MWHVLYKHTGSNIVELHYKSQFSVCFVFTCFFLAKSLNSAPISQFLYCWRLRNWLGKAFLVIKARSRLESYKTFSPWVLLSLLLALPLGNTNTVEQMTRVGSHPLCAAVGLAHLQAWQNVGQRFSGWVGVYVSLLGTCRVPSHNEETRMSRWGLNVGPR